MDADVVVAVVAGFPKTLDVEADVPNILVVDEGT
jgi:hypothetical protein